jgi:hypothetical protein
MPRYTTESTHHHGPLAGLGAGAAAVLFAFGVLALCWHRVAGQVSMAVTALTYAVMAAAAVIVCAATWYVVLWVRHRVRNPDLLAGRQAARAGAARAEAHTITAGYATPAPAPAPLPYAAPLAIEPPREIHNHFHFPDAEAAAAAVRALQELPR